MAEDTKLPPLPGSTEEDFRLNKRDPFYGKTPKEVWVKASIEHHPIVQKDKCPHRFRYTEEGVGCEMCHMGLRGKTLIIIDGHVYFKKQKLL
jgi:hypothetical protein